MFVELHILQNFAPSCLNRDDTNSPKDCEFGGYRRARISSQCIKRAIRTHFRNNQSLESNNLAQRTKRLADLLNDHLVKAGKDEAQARQVAEIVITGLGLDLDKGQTKVLLFLGNEEIASLAKSCEAHWEGLISVAQAEASSEGEPERDRKARKKAAKATIPEDFKKSQKAILDGGKAVDLALFGRMLADLPEKNIDAACQVAHALSTNAVSMEFDFYTAVDDLSPKEETGAGMMGVVEFNSACFYRYANLDFKQLTQNLGDDQELARKGVEAFLRAAVAAVPTGKQNSMAAQNPPSLVFAVVREQGLWSLANAFADPIRPGASGGLVQKSINAMETYWGRLTAAFGEEGIKACAALAVEGDLSSLKTHQKGNFQEFLNTMMKALPGGRP